MHLNDFIHTCLPSVEDELQRVVTLANGPGLDGMHHMLAYHMGWEGEGAGPEARGKRIRPLLVLLTAQAAGGDWRAALPSAAAVELVHNFSLIHDDIEDNSPLRRGRRTVWARWGIPQAVNAGDSLFTLASLALFRLSETVSPGAALRSVQVLHEACLALTQGQYLDISYESRTDLSLQDYWPMVSGKTGALLSSCTYLGALAAQAPETICQAYRRFGRGLGLAFQALDDLLGIWGDAALTGKSAESDLVSGKKSLPVLYGLEQDKAFARRWKQGPISADEVADLARQLEVEGGRAFTSQCADDLTAQALGALEEAEPQGEAGAALAELADRLLSRSA